MTCIDGGGSSGVPVMQQMLVSQQSVQQRLAQFAWHVLVLLVMSMQVSWTGLRVLQ
jgi:hypothetical protein